MIITYEKHDGNYGTCICIPEMIPWKLEAVVDRVTCGHISHALKLTAGAFEDIILTDDEFLGFLEGLDEEKEEAILALFSQIAVGAAAAVARVIREGEQILNLSEVIEAETEFWLKYNETAANGTDEDEDE